MDLQPAREPEAIQDSQYRFPYHYLPRLDRGRFQFHEVLDWGHEYLSYQMHIAELLAGMQWTSLLDVGCGDGRLVSILRQEFRDRRLVGLDYSPRAVALASAMVPEAEFLAADVTKPGLFAKPFDCATCVETIEHIDPAFLPDFIGGVRQHLEPGAALIVTVPSVNVPVTAKHYQHFTAELLTETLSGPFAVERLAYLNGVSPVAALARQLLTNRLYTVTSPAVMTAFYNFYVRRYLHSDRRKGGRILAICRAR